ncbi:stage V sporulation protein AB [Virgibacillus oceani]|uniref:Stage V sporulation protein AB n=1 Tax=Virgibacillus oceani TaxID=1479511 RepID=A0A917H205_9BACI|nr:stage V sporulation protein AB [Virgibacillus oceani]GGG64345.1 stage V sporulation protein AB [Virgibacillus oceani]
MITNLFINLAEFIIGFAGGLAVGGGFVAFLTVLGIIPRLIQLSKTHRLLHVYGACVIVGSIFGTYISFTNITWNQPIVILILWGGLHGIFNGMLAAALTEILNVFPLLSKRIGLDGHLLWLLMAIFFGKIAGSLFQWMYFVK